VIVLVGFMGAGKTTVARRLAARMGLEYRDADRVVEERAGAPISEIFERDGEAGFRKLERAVVAELLAGPDAIIALGGGALEDPATRAALGAITTVHLEVGFEEAMRRVGDGSARPMLAREDPKALFVRRRSLYRRAAAFAVATDGRAPDDVVDEILGRLTRAEPPPSPLAPVRIPVPTPARHEVVVGAGSARDLAARLPAHVEPEKAFIVTHPSLRGLAGMAATSLEAAGVEVVWGVVDEGEGSKSIATAERLLHELAAAELHRGDLVVGFGGGVVCDLAGFVASIYLRGVAVAHVATSLLAQVDAAIGGKTGVNLPHAKNLVGTIYQPALVVCDVELLATLPGAELRSGLAEVVKYGLIAEPDLLDLVATRAQEILRAAPEVLTELVARSAAIKAGVVAADERERGERAHLNYGHTFAHAIEHAAGFGRVRHGEAVAVGMMAAAYLAQNLGRLCDADVEAHRRALDSVGLPSSAALDYEALERAWRHDKKYRRGVRFVLLSGLGKPEADVAAPPETIRTALERLAG
jgi:shikimate kinase/3-dehydroquinate synthase